MDSHQEPQVPISGADSKRYCRAFRWSYKAKIMSCTCLSCDNHDNCTPLELNDASNSTNEGCLL